MISHLKKGSSYILSVFISPLEEFCGFLTPVPKCVKEASPHPQAVL